MIDLIEGDELVARAHRSLRAKGIQPEAASREEYLAALDEAETPAPYKATGRVWKDETREQATVLLAERLIRERGQDDDDYTIYAAALAEADALIEEAKETRT